MKTATLRNMMIAVAALAVAAGTASAQGLRAEIPLSFQAGGAHMLPGAYRIDARESHGSAVFVYMENLDTKTSVVLMSASQSDAPAAWRKGGDPVISFACTNGSCAVSQLWTARNSLAYDLPHAKRHGEGKIALVTLTLAR
jgi:hypothetical protein